MLQAGFPVTGLNVICYHMLCGVVHATSMETKLFDSSSRFSHILIRENCFYTLAGFKQSDNYDAF